MSILTDWRDEVLIPEIYERADIIFKEHSFKLYPWGWGSQTYLNGQRHASRKDKTKIKKGAPWYIFEEGGEGLTILEYVERRDRIEWREAVSRLAKELGLEVPHSQDYDPEAYRQYGERAKILEDANGYFIYCLESSTGAPTNEVRSYLKERGYSKEDLQKMEIGYIPSQEQLVKYLTDKKNHNRALVTEVLSITNKGIGDTHRISIPWRSGGRLKGFTFRATDPEADPKYLYTTGLKRGEGFFNISPLRGDKDLIVVEGQLDALHATIRGIDNVVATGGGNISQEQIKDARKRGARRLTLCLDQEPRAQEKILRELERLRAMDEELPIYVATLPDLGGGKTDPDRLIKEKGAEAFREAVAQATQEYYFRYGVIHKRYLKTAEDQGHLEPKQIENLKEELTALLYGVTDPVGHKRLLIDIERDWEGLGIDKETIEQTLKELQYKEDKIREDKNLRKLLTDTKQLQDQGQTDKAMELLETGIEEVRIKRGKGLIDPYSYGDWEEEISTAPQGLETGYRSLDKIVRIPQGAITFIAGRPSHGKTTLMFNLLLRMSEIYKGRKFYFFSYEEPRKYIITKILNAIIGERLGAHLSGLYPDLISNYEILRAYMRDRRTDIGIIEAGKEKLRELIDGGRIEVVNASKLTVESLSSVISYENSRRDIEIGGIFIDYIQRMSTEDKRAINNTREEIARISKKIVRTAQETGLPILLGCQLNRATVTSGDKRPSLENLKEAGNLEEDANVVLAVYNESREKDTQEDGSPWEDPIPLEVIVLKSRDGAVNNSVKLEFVRPILKITDPEGKSYRSSIEFE